MSKGLLLPSLIVLVILGGCACSNCADESKLRELKYDNDLAKSKARTLENEIDRIQRELDDVRQKNTNLKLGLASTMTTQESEGSSETGHTDTSPPGTEDGYVYASRCPTPIPTSGDASPAIEGCLDALSEEGRGGTLYMQNATYTLSTPVDLATDNRLKTRIVGSGGYGGGTIFDCSASPCFRVKSDSLLVADAPELENFSVMGNGSNSSLISVERANGVRIHDVALQNAREGLRIDSMQRARGRGSDASYNEIYGLRVRNTRVAVHLPDQGGINMIGGHILTTRAGDEAVRIGSLASEGNQYIFLNTLIDGGTSTRGGLGIGFHVVGNVNNLDVVGAQIENAAKAYYIEGGSGHSITGGSINNATNGTEGVVVSGTASVGVCQVSFADPLTDNPDFVHEDGQGTISECSYSGRVATP